jgi:hypothetical protein
VQDRLPDANVRKMSGRDAVKANYDSRLKDPANCCGDSSYSGQESPAALVAPLVVPRLMVAYGWLQYGSFRHRRPLEDQRCTIDDEEDA